MGNIRERAARVVFAVTASMSVAAVLLICLFLFANGVPAIAEIGVFKFLFGTVWKPGSGKFGVLPMIVGSLYVTAGAMLAGVPLGLLTAIYISRFASKRTMRLLDPAVKLLAGIPSVIFGFFGLVVIVPVIRNLFGGNGTSMLAASLLLGAMILPTVITVAVTALNAVPANYYEGALALGATHERAVFRVVLPAAKSGVTAGVILGMGRAVGEATAVKMVAGNQARLPGSIFDGVRTLTSNIVLEMGYSTDLHRGALIATGVVLFVFIMAINLLFSLLKRDRA